MTDQVTPEGGATPVLSGANATFAQAQAEAEAEAKAKPKEGDAVSPPAAADPGDKPKPAKTGEQLRIDELTRRYREEQRRSDRLMRAHEELLQRMNSQQPPAPRQPDTAEKSLKDFNYDEAAFRKYERDRVQASAAETAKQLAAQLREQDAVQRRREKFEERATTFAKANPDYNEVLEGVWACSQPMAEAIEESDEGPAVAYYLAQNPDIAAQLSRLSAVQAGREITRIEDRLIAERKKALEKSVSQAPPPPPKIDASDPGNVEKDPSKMTDAQFRKWREGFQARR